MLSGFLNRIFGSQTDRERRKSDPTMAEIHRWAEEYRQLSDTALAGKTQAFRDLLADRNGPRATQRSELEEQLRGDLEPDERERLNDEFDRVGGEIRQTEVDVLDEILPSAFGAVVETCRRLRGRSWEGVAGPTPCQKPAETRRPGGG